jgi:uncharacterized protein
MAGSDRILTLDVLRGLALFGILLVNMAFFSLPMFYYPPGMPIWQRPIDRHLDTIIHYAGQSEFLTLFSFLFGLGLAMQLSRAGSDQQAKALFSRRIVTLLGFGLLHAFLIWMGDVLVWYAVTAAALWLFRSARPKTVLMVAAAAFLVRIARLEWLALASSSFSYKISEGAALALVDQCLRVYAHGTVSEIFVRRAQDVWFQYSHPIDFLLHVFSIFLMGLYAGKKKILEGTNDFPGFFVRAWYVGLVFGIGGHALRYALPYFAPRIFAALAPTIEVVSDLALAVFYLASVVLAMRHSFLAKVLAPLASVGRMTLTNYLAQSLMVTTLVYSYGFGLYGRLRPLDWCLLTCLIYAAQALVSIWWLRRFAYGPAEWLWRTLVYRRAIPIRLRHQAPSAGGRILGH